MPPLDANTLRDAMVRFRKGLEEHREELNSLNVYPIPDGDTGTNMFLTQQAVEQALGGLEGAGGGGVHQVGSAIARAALMGARGNSGVILAQALRGFVDGLGAGDDAAPDIALARALERAASEAHRAVAHPARGTMLDVLADAAAAAAEGSGRGDGAEEVSRAALQEGRASLARTTAILPELRRAGVVDAGGKGIVLFLDALHAAISGGEQTEKVGPPGPLARTGFEAPAPRLAAGTTQKFEVQYLLEAEEAEIAGLRTRLAELGNSLVIVGGSGTFRIHVHTNDPDQAIEAAHVAGSPGSISITDLEDAVERCLVGQVRGVRTMPEQTSALVAVADGDGIEGVFASLGALVVRGGPGNNASVAQILDAIDAAASGSVLVLPNHENVVPAAEAAAERSEKHVRVVRSLSVPQGVSAAAAFHPDADPDTNERTLAEAAAGCAWGEVARSVRDADTPAGPVAEGDFLAMVEGRAVSVGEDAESLAAGLVERLREGGHEVLTVFVGAGVRGEDAAALERRLREQNADLEIEFHFGGQPGYPYLIGLE